MSWRSRSPASISSRCSESRPGLAGALSWLVAERRPQRAQASSDLSAEQEGQETKRLSEQILARMRALFRGALDDRRAG